MVAIWGDVKGVAGCSFICSAKLLLELVIVPIILTICAEVLKEGGIVLKNEYAFFFSPHYNLFCNLFVLREYEGSFC